MGLGKQLREFHLSAAQARSALCSQADRAKKCELADQQLEAIWHQLTGAFWRREKTPGFGRAKIELYRSGQCFVTVEEENLFSTRPAKAAQIGALSAGSIDAAFPGLAASAASAARQCFFFVRDLTHRHYHHSRNSDLLSTTYDWTPADDQFWRRETQYGLVRMAIYARRRDQALMYKQALGIIAYAEAFQRHLCGWFIDSKLEPSRSDWGFAYDFASLRASIDASLKVRELRDSQIRQTLLFAFGFAVTCLGIVIAELRTENPRPRTSNLFYGYVAWITAHPFVSMGLAAVVAVAIDQCFIGLSTNPKILVEWRDGIGRFAEAVMGSIKAVLPMGIGAYIATTLLMIAISGILGAIAGGLLFNATKLLLH